MMNSYYEITTLQYKGTDGFVCADTLGIRALRLALENPDTEAERK